MSACVQKNKIETSVPTNALLGLRIKYTLKLGAFLSCHKIDNELLCFEVVLHLLPNTVLLESRDPVILLVCVFVAEDRVARLLLRQLIPL